MAVKHVDLDDCYLPSTNTQDIVVDVAIGDGQQGSYSIFLGRKLISTNSPGNVGTKADVRDKNTIVSVTIVDELKETNWTSITVYITEAGSESKFGPYKTQAENHLDTIVYTLKLVHK